MKNAKKRYQSQIDYNKTYNQRSSSIQISKELHIEVKEYLKDKKSTTIRNWIEEIIKEKIK
jgi:hypothetical protein